MGKEILKTMFFIKKKKAERELAAARADYEAEIERYKRSVEDLVGRISALESELSEYVMRAEKAESSLSAARNANKALKSLNTRLSKKLDKAKAKKESLDE